MLDANIRDWLVIIRGERTQQQVAELAGVSRSYYTEIETGAKTPSVEVAQKLGKAIGFDWTLFFEPQCRVKQLKRTKKEAI